MELNNSRHLAFSMRNSGTPRIISDIINKHLSEDADNGCGSPPPAPGPKPTPATQCLPGDITILVDGSDSITRHQWSTQVDAITDWIDGYWQDSGNTQITVKQFSDEVRIMIGPKSSAEFEKKESFTRLFLENCENVLNFIMLSNVYNFIFTKFHRIALQN